MDGTREQRNKLLEIIHSYYPIGSEQLEHNYSGYPRYKKILTNKINDIIEAKETKWVSFVNSMKPVYEADFFDMNYHQFPSHIARVNIINESNSKFDFQQTLVINISLLCNYYTVFFEDLFIFKNYSDNLSKPKIKLVYLNQKKNDQDLSNQIAEIHQNIKLLYTEYEYINHKILFQSEIKAGVPYNEGYEYATPPYFLYNFLFDGFFKEQCFYVLE